MALGLESLHKRIISILQETRLEAPAVSVAGCGIVKRIVLGIRYFLMLRTPIILLGTPKSAFQGIKKVPDPALAILLQQFQIQKKMPKIRHGTENT
ncbi:MAG: hypothetical protein LBC51_08365 [Treponema sp.]|jgi:hypothetical protein|nr:hypothetical protein [Treponema sp.]